MTEIDEIDLDKLSTLVAVIPDTHEEMLSTIDIAARATDYESDIEVVHAIKHLKDLKLINRHTESGKVFYWMTKQMKKAFSKLNPTAIKQIEKVSKHAEKQAEDFVSKVDAMIETPQFIKPEDDKPNEDDKIDCAVREATKTDSFYVDDFHVAAKPLSRKAHENRRLIDLLQYSLHCLMEGAPFIEKEHWDEIIELHQKRTK